MPRAIALVKEGPGGSVGIKDVLPQVVACGKVHATHLALLLDGLGRCKCDVRLVLWCDLAERRALVQSIDDALQRPDFSRGSLDFGTAVRTELPSFVVVLDGDGAAFRLDHPVLNAFVFGRRGTLEPVKETPRTEGVAAWTQDLRTPDELEADVAGDLAVQKGQCRSLAVDDLLLCRCGDTVRVRLLWKSLRSSHLKLLGLAQRLNLGHQ